LTDRRITSRRLRSVVFAVLGIALAWEIFSRSLVAYLAEVAPEAALIVRANDPTALVNITERRLNLEHHTKDTPIAQSGGETSSRIPSFARHARKASPNGAESQESEQARATEPLEEVERLPSNAVDANLRDEIRILAEAALRRDPMNSRALRILGQVADAANDEAAALKLMQAAARRSPREGVAVFWLMRESFERKDYAAAVQHADVLLRARPQVVTQVMPTLARLAEDKDANGELKKLFSTSPPWRSLFFTELLRSITDARTPLDLLLSIKDTPIPPTSAELSAYLALLFKNNFHELAYYVWLQFLPPEQLASAGRLFNGGFEALPSGLPFDWVITPGSGVTIDFAPRPDGTGRALLVQFGQGRVDFRGVAQMVMLPPGVYRLQGQHMGRIVGRRGLEWRVACAGATAPLAKSEMNIGSTPVWTEFGVTFTIPPTGCRAQQIQLWLDARSASEQLVTGTAWYDALQIARVE